MTLVPAEHVDDTESVLFRDAALNKPGQFSYYQTSRASHAGMNYVCPCGCGALGSLPFRNETPERPSWVWDGNVEIPTLTPSVQRTVGCKWHGFLTDGVWRTV